MFETNPLGRIVWEDRYGLKDESGNLVEKDILDTFGRVAKAIASKEKDSKKWEKKFYDILAAQEFCPAGRVLAHAGTHYSQLLNCFVLPFENDSLEAIMDTAKNMAIVQKFGGGCIGGESLVITNKGPISIRELVEKKDPNIRVLSLNENTLETEYCDVLDYHTTPLPGNRVFEVKFRDAKGGTAAKIRASDWHPFFVFDGEKIVQVRSDELQPGMAVIGSTALDCTFDAWGWLLGYITGDGAICSNGKEEYTRIRIVDAYEKNIARAAEIMGVPYAKSPDPRYTAQVWACEAYGEMAGKIKCEFGGNQTCYTKHIPNSIWIGSDACKFSFLVGYLDSDGSFNKEKKRFEVFTVSEKLALEIVALAGSIGIRSSVRFRKARKLNESAGWEIRFLKSSFIIDSIVSLSSKYSEMNTGWVEGILSLSACWREKLVSAGVDVSTKAWRHPIDIGGTQSSLVYWLQHSKASRDTAANVLKTCGKDRLAKAVLSCQIVQSSDPVMVDEILYDLTVDKNQTYLASDPLTGAYVVVHNTGFDFSKLRPSGSYIKGVNGRSCGVLGFIHMMSTVSEVIEQGGSRRGASIGMLEVWHPDVWEYISYKTEHNWDRLREFMDVQDEDRWKSFKFENLYKLQMYNISVGVSDEFFTALKNDAVWPFLWNGKEWDLYTVQFRKHLGGVYVDKNFEVTADCDKTAIWKVKKKVPFPTARDTFEVVSKRKVKASEVWTRICYNAWADGCPGLLNMSTARRMHNLEYVHPISSTNPCGEQPLGSYGSCNLGSLVLMTFVKDGNFDFSRFAEVIQTAIRFMDDVIDCCEFPLKAIEETARQERRVGLGTMGVHDMLIAMGLDYDSVEGRSAVEKVLCFLRDETYRASIELAKEKGSFPIFDKEKYIQSGFIKTLPVDIVNNICKYGIRNSHLLSQAPTGSIGTMYGVSTGCEPYYALSFQRNTRLGSYPDGCRAFIQWQKDNPDKDKPTYFKTAMEIIPEDHVRMMMVFSKYIDSAVSKTVNLPESATVEDVKKVFLYAMDNGIKGLTVFREDSKEGVLVRKDKPVPAIEEAKKVVHELMERNQNLDVNHDTEDSRMSPKKRGNRTVGATSRVHMQGHNLYVTANRNEEGDLVELFVTVGESKNPDTHHTSGVEDSWAEGLAKTISLALRAGVQPTAIIRNLKNIPSDKPVFSTVGDCKSSELIPSPPHAIARVMEEELRYAQPQQIQITDEIQIEKKGCCKNCSSTNLRWLSKTCYECIDCGASGCGS